MHETAAGREVLQRLLYEVYPDWDDWGAGAPYARIEARRMHTFRMAS